MTRDQEEILAAYLLQHRSAEFNPWGQNCTHPVRSGLELLFGAAMASHNTGRTPAALARDLESAGLVRDGRTYDDISDVWGVNPLYSDWGS